jgi:hypothetical protein
MYMGRTNAYPLVRISATAQKMQTMRRSGREEKEGRLRRRDGRGGKGKNECGGGGGGESEAEMRNGKGGRDGGHQIGRQPSFNGNCCSSILPSHKYIMQQLGRGTTAL